MNLQMTKRNQLRIKYAIAFVLLLLVEVMIALYVHDTFVRPYVGDMLVVILVYSFTRIFIPERCRLLPLYVFLFAAGVEVLQYFKLVHVLGLEHNRFLRIVLGSVFDIKDIVSYGVGSMLLEAYERILG
ncbi:DUF2809 domain-containing protein [Clostridium boliviensis]|uniref:DUF2809 domain-containing protein n=1 Tax=Clostridium boliviensis TaxID=318465 RepID=A0ABU4GGU7_9CLOT|nr:DUF2809 domain-containing protein [Clostridium boliviensis]MDW2796168.1 DUF2809 domain-containing protein [Clostridium boliviensis]